MSFRHFTKLKEIADRVGCDSSDCTTNGALLDRIYETPITPVEPTGPIDAKIDIQNITARFVKPVEGHTYLGNIPAIPSENWILEFDNVLGYREESNYFFPVMQMLADNILGTGMTFFNDVENPNSGNFMYIKLGTGSEPIHGFTDEDVETIKNEIATNGSYVIAGANQLTCKLTITSIAE